MSVTKLNDDPKDDRYRVRVYNPHGREHRKIVRGKRAADAHEKAMAAKLARCSIADPSSGKITFHDYAIAQIDARDLDPHTRAHYLYDCERFLFPLWGARPMRSLMHTDARQLTAFIKRHAKGNGAVNAITLARSICRAAFYDRIIDHSPFEGIPSEKRKVTKANVPTLAQVRQAIEGSRSEPSALIVAGLVGTGLRAAELCGVDLEADVNWLKRTLTVRQQLKYLSPSASTRSGYTAHGFFYDDVKTEAGEDRVIPLADWTLAAFARLVELGKGETFTFPWGRPDALEQASAKLLLGSAIQPSSLTGRVRYVAKWAEQDFSPHDLRKRFATTLEQNGVPLRTVQYLLGHEPRGVTMSVYVGIDPESLTRARTVLNDAWKAAAGEQRKRPAVSLGE